MVVAPVMASSSLFITHRVDGRLQCVSPVCLLATAGGKIWHSKLPPNLAANQQHIQTPFSRKINADHDRCDSTVLAGGLHSIDSLPSSFIHILGERKHPSTSAGVMNSVCHSKTQYLWILKTDAHEYEMIHLAQMSVMFSQLLCCSAWEPSPHFFTKARLKSPSRAFLSYYHTTLFILPVHMLSSIINMSLICVQSRESGHVHAL